MNVLEIFVHKQKQKTFYKIIKNGIINYLNLVVVFILSKKGVIFMSMNRYDTFENESELRELEKKNRARSREYMQQPSLWDMPTISRKIKVYSGSKI